MEGLSRCRLKDDALGGSPEHLCTVSAARAVKNPMDGLEGTMVEEETGGVSCTGGHWGRGEFLEEASCSLDCVPEDVPCAVLNSGPHGCMGP